MRLSENLSNILTALCKVQAEIKNPIKTEDNKGVQGNPKYANLEDTLAEYVRPVLTAHGMSFFQSVKSDENGRVGVNTTLFHESGEFIEGDFVYCDVVIPVSNKGNKVLTEGQATGVCITYLRRYSLNAALGINGDKDTDGSYTDTPLNYEPMTTERALNYTLSFGKYSGEKLTDIWKKDMGYIIWLGNNEKTDAEVKEALQLINEYIEQSKGAKNEI